MGLWSWLFGAKEPELEEDGNRLIDVAYVDGNRHGPYKRYRKDGSLLEEGTYVDGRREGPFTIHGRESRIEGTYLADQPHGPQRVISPDGTVETDREYEHGEQVSGPHEKRDEIRKDWVRERGTIKRGKREGVWREYGVPRDGTSPLLLRCQYQDGVLDGPYETWFYDGLREIEGQYRAGRRVGRWTYYRHGGSTRAELDYDDGAIATWRWLTHDGAERPLVSIVDDDDLVRWLALADAWELVETQRTYAVELAIDGWPADQRARPLAWLDERLAEQGPLCWSAGSDWLEVMTNSDEPDLRTRYVNRIDIDNQEWNEEQTARLRRFASQILSLGLVECAAVPDISALFDVPWPKLATLGLHECGPVDGMITKLYTSPIEHLELTYEPLSAAELRALVEAPWFASLQILRLTVEDRAIVDALADRGMPELRVLELDCYELELATGDLEVLIDRELRPTLATLELQGIRILGDLPQRDGLEIRIRE